MSRSAPVPSAFALLAATIAPAPAANLLAYHDFDDNRNSSEAIELVKVTCPFFLPNGRKARFWRSVADCPPRCFPAAQKPIA